MEEWNSGVVVQWKSKWNSSIMEEWNSGVVAERKSRRVEQQYSGRVEVKKGIVEKENNKDC